MTQKPFLNLGCGRVILPAPKPAHYGLIPDGVCEYALYHNVDRNQQPGVDEVADVFQFPYPWKDNSFDGALLAHLAEHCPHQINTGVAQPGSMLYERYHGMQDAWYCMFYELWRVLTPGSLIHILSPYAWSDGAVTDPTHTRMLTPASFTHSMQPDLTAPFAYATGGLHLVMDEPPRVNLTPAYQHLAGHHELLQQALNTQINVAYEFYVKLRVIK